MKSLLNPGATQADIDELEQMIGKKLPADFVEFYMIRDGQEEGEERLAMIQGQYLLPVKWITRAWNSKKEIMDQMSREGEYNDITSDPEDGIKNDWWNPYWIPFTYDGSGNNICIDLDPAPGGDYGQVISWFHDSGFRELYASSFEDYIDFYLAGLKRGNYVFIKGVGLNDREFGEEY
ncbi:MAG: SMI1/KNR4 family protein [Pseudobacter sp.]|uniref:SMI1/KNR4 family protein n=1 Tax=Pseudobacter sp. TaxID=2045420 RepID=UPI003F7D5730